MLEPGSTGKFQALAAIRPTMAAPDISDVLATSDNPPRPDKIYRWKNKCIVYLDADDTVKAITYLNDFPPDVRIDQAFLGMSNNEAFAAYPKLQISPDISSSHGWHDQGVTSDGFELSVRLLDGQVRGVSLAPAGTAAARARHAAEMAPRSEMARREQELANRWTKISDPDEMLDDWASHYPASCISPELLASYVAWLKAASPAEWHQAADAWNWDYGITPLLWIIRQSKCDLATAMRIYLDAEPSYYRQYENDRSRVAGHEFDVFDLITEITSRVINGFYSRQELAFKAADVSVELGMPDKLHGREIPSRTFNDGFPIELHPLAR